MNLPSRKVLIISACIIAVPVLAVAWWLLSPLFLNKTVVEEFPMSAGAQMPVGVTQAEAENIMSGMAKVNMESVEAMPSTMAEATVLAKGQLRDADRFHKGSGDVTLYELPDGSGLLRFEGLDVTNGPDLHVIVTPHPNPSGRSELQEAGYTDLGQLKGNRGDQNYPVASGMDLASIGSVVIYCMPFHVVFSVASLQGQ